VVRLIDITVLGRSDQFIVFDGHGKPPRQLTVAGASPEAMPSDPWCWNSSQYLLDREPQRE
jgi:hypothetical protein